MNPTQGISFPRSGHGAIFAMMQSYFGDALVYCDALNSRGRHCGCRAVPCINPKRTFGKSHDPEVREAEGIPVLPDQRYFIQYRSPVRAIASNFRLHLSKVPEDESRTGWEVYARGEISYWNRFVDKWVRNESPAMRSALICSYESLLANPETRTREILEFLSRDRLREDAVAELSRKFSVRRRDRLSGFKYFDTGFFRELEALTDGRLRELDLPDFHAEF